MHQICKRILHRRPSGCYWRSCLWLSLWIWSVPVPSFHCHDCYRTADAEQWLMQHIVVHHRGHDSSEESHGWHLHLLFARCPHGGPIDHSPDGPPSDHEPPTVRLTEQTEIRRVTVEEEYSPVTPLLVVELAAPAVADSHVFLSGDFLQTWSRSVRLSELLSLWRC